MRINFSKLDALPFFCSFISLSTIKRKLSLWPRVRERFLYSLTLWIGIQVNAWANRNYRSVCSLWQLYLLYIRRMDGWQCDLLSFFLSFTCAYIPILSLQSPQETSIIPVLFHRLWFLLALSLLLLVFFSTVLFFVSLLLSLSCSNGLESNGKIMLYPEVYSQW